MLARLRSAAVVGVEALAVTVEVDVSFGFPGVHDGGAAGRERAREPRPRPYRHPQLGLRVSGHRITVNLAPADIRKGGASYDLPIALGVLAANGVIEPRLLPGIVLLGELSLDGSIHPIRGVLPVAVAAKREGIAAILLPRANAAEALVVEGLTVLAVDSLVEAVEVLNGGGTQAQMKMRSADIAMSTAASESGTVRETSDSEPDFADVIGQSMAKRALEIAAAGGHNLLLIGSPGGGKTMMARRLAGILPPLDFDEALDCTSVHSVAGTLPAGTALMRQRPFRAPHHTISEVAMVGGGSIPRPGEISLAHNGVLFLDELPEFDRRTLEALRQPLEEGRVTITRTARAASFPARFMLIGAMNPCPCGFRGDRRRSCQCSDPQVERYTGRISGPLRDRIDLVVEVPAAGSIRDECAADCEPSRMIRDRVIAARRRQHRRFGESGSRLNRQLEGRQLRTHCRLDAGSTAHSRSRDSAFWFERARARSRHQSEPDDCRSCRRRRAVCRTRSRGAPVPARVITLGA